MARHFGAHGTSEAAETMANGTEVTENDFESLFLEDDEDDWNGEAGGPSSSSGDSGGTDDGPSAGGCDDFC